MDSLVLIILGAVWAAVLIPPLLRSRIENRPNSSVTDFRRQLNKLQDTVPGRATGQQRSMARPLAPSPLARPAAPGRPGQPAQQRSSGRQHSRAATATREPRPAGSRSHGDPSGGHDRPMRQRADRPVRRVERADRRSATHERRREPAPSPADPALARRRRSNVLMALVILVGGSLLLAAMSQSAIMLYFFALSFLALCGYLYLLSQARKRETQSWGDGWMS